MCIRDRYLFFAGLLTHKPSLIRKLGDHQSAILTHLSNGKAQIPQVWHVLPAGITEITPGHLACTFQQMPGNGSLSQQGAVDVYKRQAVL